MQEEKHIAGLLEVKRNLENVLKDPEGLLPHQRLLMAGLSLGMQHMIELWLHKSRAIKPGASIKHEWLASEERRLKIRLAGALTKQLETIKNSDKVLSLARDVERDRNDIIYGAPLTSDRILKLKIEAFLELKKAVEESIGEALWQD